MNIESFRENLLKQRIQARGKGKAKRYTKFTGNIEDIKKLLTFDDELKAKGYRYDTRKNYLVTISKLIRFFKGKPLSETKKEDLIKFYNHLVEKEKLSELTINQYKIRIAHYFLWLNGGKKYPDCVSDLKGKRIKRIKIPEHIPTVEDIKKLITVADTIREKCIVFVLYELGARRNEFLNLKVGDLTFDSNGCKVRIESEKNGNDRIVRIVESVPLLKLYLKQHRASNDPNAWLWYVGSNPKKRLSEMGLTSLFHRLTIKAGLGKEFIDKNGKKRIKKIHPHLLRHRRITEWIKKGLSESVVRYLAGWTATSSMVEVYNHATLQDIDEALLEKVYYKRVKDRKEIRSGLEPVICNRCNTENSSGIDYCVNCYQPLSESANTQLDIIKNIIAQILTEAWKHPNPKEALPSIVEKFKKNVK